MHDAFDLAREAGLTVDPERVAVRFREPAPHVMRADAAGTALGLEPGERAAGFEVPGEKYTIFRIPRRGNHPPRERLKAAAARFAERSDVADVGLVYRIGPNRLMAADRVAIGFRRGAAGTLTRLERMGLQVLDARGREYLVRLPSGQNALATAKALRELTDVAYAEADFVEFAKPVEPGPAEPLAGSRSDPYANSQWARAHTGADAALRRVGGGSPAIRIAILDSGIDRIHRDLQASMAVAWDTTEKNPKPHPLPGDWHGTACAGLAAAVPFNGEGIIGFGGGCSILDVRVFHSDSVSGEWTMAASALAAGIKWAVDQKADVISLSWYTEKEHVQVTSAIADALARGRGKKGCVVVAGTGNDLPGSTAGVKYPARLDGVIAVAATNKGDKPVTHERDGTSWSSAGGKEVALAAPGIRQWTTDISGTSGLVALKDPTGSYTGNFAGTSAATAIVAGVAGLMLSADPELTAADVRAILRQTAYQPPGFDPMRLGAGRLDAGAAVEEVVRRREQREAATRNGGPGAGGHLGVEETLEISYASRP